MRKIIYAVLATALSLSVLNATAQTADETAKYKNVLKSYMELTGSNASFEAALDQMFLMLGAAVSFPDKESQDKAVREIREKALDQLIDKFLPIYQRNIAVEDLEAVNEFYQTPAGKNLAAMQPKLVSESMNVAQEWGMGLQKMIQEAMQNASANRQ